MAAINNPEVSLDMLQQVFKNTASRINKSILSEGLVNQDPTERSFGENEILRMVTGEPITSIENTDASRGFYLLTFNYGQTSSVGSKVSNQLTQAHAGELMNFEELAADYIFSPAEKALLEEIADLWVGHGVQYSVSDYMEQTPGLIEEKRRYHERLISSGLDPNTTYSPFTSEHVLSRRAQFRAGLPITNPTQESTPLATVIREKAIRLVNSLVEEEFTDWVQAGTAVDTLLRNWPEEPRYAYRLRSALRILKIADPENLYAGFNPTAIAGVHVIEYSKAAFRIIKDGGYSTLFTGRIYYEQGVDSFVSGSSNSFSAVYANLFLYFGLDRPSSLHLLKELRLRRKQGGGDDEIPSLGWNRKGGTSGFIVPNTSMFNEPAEDMSLLSNALNKSHEVISDTPPEYLTIPNYSVRERFQNYMVLQPPPDKKDTVVKTHYMQPLTKFGDEYFIDLPTPPGGILNGIDDLTLASKPMNREDYQVLYDPWSRSYCLRVNPLIPFEDLVAGATFTTRYTRDSNDPTIEKKVRPVNANQREVLKAVLTEFFGHEAADFLGEEDDSISITEVLQSIKRGLGYNTKRRAKDSRYSTGIYNTDIIKQSLEKRYGPKGARSVPAGTKDPADEFIRGIYDVLFMCRKANVDGKHLVTCKESARIAEVVMNYLEPEAGWRYTSCNVRTSSWDNNSTIYGALHAIIISDDGRVIDITPDLEEDDNIALAMLMQKYFPSMQD